MDQIKELKKAVCLSDAEAKKYLHWVEKLQPQFKQDGISIQFEFMPGIGWRVTANYNNYLDLGKDFVLRDWID